MSEEEAVTRRIQELEKLWHGGNIDSYVAAKKSGRPHPCPHTSYPFPGEPSPDMSWRWGRIFYIWWN